MGGELIVFGFGAGDGVSTFVGWQGASYDAARALGQHGIPAKLAVYKPPGLYESFLSHCRRRNRVNAHAAVKPDHMCCLQRELLECNVSPLLTLLAQSSQHPIFQAVFQGDDALQ
jgi:hypothetical protein